MARSVLCHVIVKLADEQAQRAIAPSDKSRVALFVLFPVTETVSNNEKKKKSTHAPLVACATGLC